MALYLLDTGVLIRSLRSEAPEYAEITEALAILEDAGHEFVFFAQNAIEAWGVLTRPATARQGWGLTLSQADALLNRCEKVYALIPDSPSVFGRWRGLVRARGVSGASVHDARLVAAMLEAKIDHVLTLNVADFARYAPEGIVAETPAQIVAAKPTP
jgi:predicted nucleic acid-binding protein